MTLPRHLLPLLLGLGLGLAGCGSETTSGDDGTGATTASGGSDAGGTTTAGGQGGTGGSPPVGGGGSGGAPPSPQTGPDALWVQRFGGGAVCHRRLRRVAATPDQGWIVAGSVMPEDAFVNATCTVEIGNTTISAQPVAQWSVSYIAKMDSSGSPVWVLEFPYNRVTPEIIGDVAVDSQGNSYVAGRPFTSFTIGGLDVAAGAYLMKIDSAGNPIAVTQSLAGHPHDVEVDANDDVYVGWSASPGTIRKFSPQLSVLGDAAYIANGSSDDTITGMAIDDTASVLFSAIGSSFQLFGDVVLGKLDPSLSSAWFTQTGGENDQTAFGVASDSAGGVVAIGAFEVSADLGGSLLSGPATGSGGFIARFDASGVHLWSHAFGNSLQHDCCEGPRIRRIPAGGVAIAGGAGEGVLDFGQGLIPLPQADAVFLARIQDSGVTQWARTFGTDAFATDVAVNTSGRIAIVGVMRSTTDFGSGPVTVPADSYGDGFLAVFPTD